MNIALRLEFLFATTKPSWRNISRMIRVFGSPRMWRRSSGASLCDRSRLGAEGCEIKRLYVRRLWRLYT